MSEPIIEVRDVSFAYHDVDLLKRVDFTVDKGSFLVISGQNGTGKSTLLKLILGLLPLEQGKILCWEKVSYVSQRATSFNTDFPVTVEEVIRPVLSSPFAFFRPEGKPGREKIGQVLTQVGMTGLEKSLLGRLSGGQQQKVFIARALAEDRQVLLLDEPTVGIDAESISDICGLLRELNRSGRTIIMVTHDRQAVSAYATHELIIRPDGNAKMEAFHGEAG